MDNVASLSSNNGDFVFLDCVGWPVYSQVPSNSYISHEAGAGDFDGLGLADLAGAGCGGGGGGCGGGGCGGGGCAGGW